MWGGVKAEAVRGCGEGVEIKECGEGGGLKCEEECVSDVGRGQG